MRKLRTNLRFAVEPLKVKMTNDKKVINFGLYPKGKTLEKKIKNYNKNWKKAEKAVKKGKIINLTDLLSQAEQLHIEKQN